MLAQVVEQGTDVGIGAGQDREPVSRAHPGQDQQPVGVFQHAGVKRALAGAVSELTGEARAMQEFSFQVFEAFTAATVLYLLVNVVVVTAMRFLERRVAIPGYISGK